VSPRVLYLDCAGGAAGDMVLCALTEAADCGPLIDELPGTLGFADATIDWPGGRSGGFAARRLTVGFDPEAHPHHRNLADVEAIIDGAELPEAVALMAGNVFRTPRPKARSTACPPARSTSTKWARWMPSSMSSAPASPSTNSQ